MNLLYSHSRIIAGLLILASLCTNLPILSQRTLSQERTPSSIHRNFELFDYFVTFKGTNGTTEAVYVFGVQPADFAAFTNSSQSIPKVYANVNLYSESWEQVAGTTGKTEPIWMVPQVQILDNMFFVYAIKMEIMPGSYCLISMVQESASGKQVWRIEDQVVPDYSTDELMMSDILPAFQISEMNTNKSWDLVMGDLRLLPLPILAIEFDRPLFIYYEIYNLARDEVGRTNYRTDYSVSIAPYDEKILLKLYQGLRKFVIRGDQQPVVTSSYNQSGFQSDVRANMEIDMSALVSTIDRLEIYRLTISITDNLTGETTSHYLLFRLLPDW